MNSSDSDLAIILTTCDSQQQAEMIAKGLLEKKLVACVNILPQMQSLYCWQGKICNDPEHQLVLKTRTTNVAAVKDWLEQHHSYDVPEIIVLSPADASRAYHQWILDVC